MTYTGSTPDTPRANDWRDQAACREEDADLFFPKGTTGPHLLTIEDAKTICRRCPSAEACLDYALNEPVTEGIWGGLTERQRASIRRAKARHNIDAAAIAARAEAARRPPKKPRTLQSVFDDGITRLHGGHLAWTGLTEIKIQGRKYSPKQLAFTLDRGHFPVGRVLVDCGVSACVLARHLRDNHERWQARSGRTTVEAHA